MNARLVVAAVGLMAGAAAAQPPEAVAARVNVDFGGGPMRDYVAALKKAVAPASVNVVISGDSSKVELPAVSLKGASLDSAVMLLEMVELPQFEVDVAPGPDEPGSSRVYVVRTRYVGPTAAQREAQGEAHTRIEVFSLRDLLSPPPGMPADPDGVTTIDALLTAVQTATTLGDGRSAPELKYHPDSGVLVLRGTGAQLDGARQVLGEVRSDLIKYREAAVVARDREANLVHDMREARVRLQSADAELDYMRRQLQQVEKMVAGGHASTEELAKGQLAIQRQEADVESAKIRMERAAEALEAFQKGGRPSPPPQSLKSADQVRARIKALQDELDVLRETLKKMESSGPR